MRPRAQYADGERVVLWTNKIGPYHNPMETYHYDDMPFCRPADTEPTHKAYGIGEILDDDLISDSRKALREDDDTRNTIELCGFVRELGELSSSHIPLVLRERFPAATACMHSVG